jgi:hypothetical protein
MNATIEPREVTRPFARRWLRTALALILRSPVRFGLLIALLGCLDTSAVSFAAGYVVEKVWIDRLGIVALPLLWVLVSAVARGADDNSLTWQALSLLGRRSVWIGALTVGLGMAALNWLFHSLFHGYGAIATHNPPDYLQHQGDLLASIEASVVLVVGSVGLTYCPLLASVPELSALSASGLSKKADKVNGLVTILTMTSVLAIGAIYLTLAVPAYGMTTAAFLVFFGVLSYVAYRDIFEQRGANLPEPIVLPKAEIAIPVGRSQEARRDCNVAG